MVAELPRVLVGVDFSAGSERAAAEAARLARQMGAQLDLVHVYAHEGPASLSAGIERARQALDELEHTARGDGFVAKVHLGVGNVVIGLCDYIRRLRPSLVVVGSHGCGGLTRVSLGSVAENLLRCASVPVLVVPAVSRVRCGRDATWACGACGHVLLGHESTGRCSQCGAEPPQWTAASHRADAA
jgi:nucleotide-binding universal stress UspA family protein